MPTINRNRIHHKELPYRHENDKSSMFYNTIQWRNLRNYYIRRHPLCEICLSKDKVTPAEEVHHRVPFMSGTTYEERYALLTDEDNLMSLCKECHDEVHRKMINIH